MTAFARSTDPQTSHDAAAIAPEHLKQEVLECILRSGATGMTLDDLEDAIPGARVVSISPNPARLAEAGLIQLEGSTRKGRSGRQQQVWIGVDGPPIPMQRHRRKPPTEALLRVIPPEAFPEPPSAMNAASGFWAADMGLGIKHVMNAQAAHGWNYCRKVMLAAVEGVKP